MFSSVWNHRFLISQLIKREVIGRYRGSVFGLLWSFMHPLLMLLVYIFVFGVVFSMRWGLENENKAQFGLVLFSGLIIHGLFAECLTRSPSLIHGNPQYVKKVVFPLEILPIVILGSALFHTLVSIIVLVIALYLINDILYWSLFWIPIVLAPLAILSVGAGWLLSSATVFVRDIGHIVGILATLLLFLSPIFYPLSAVPDNLQAYMYLNPLTFIIEQFRLVVLWGESPNWNGLAVYTIIAMFFCWLSYLWFQRTRNSFADVI